MPAGVRVTPLKPSVGARISGFRFDGKPLGDTFRAALRDVLHNRGLVVFEPGTVTAEHPHPVRRLPGRVLPLRGTAHAPRAGKPRRHDDRIDEGQEPPQPHLACGRRLPSRRARVHRAVRQAVPGVRRRHDVQQRGVGLREPRSAFRGLSGNPHCDPVGGRHRPYHRPLPRRRRGDAGAHPDASLRNAAHPHPPGDRPQVGGGERVRTPPTSRA